jgi:hypothetical protein
MPSTPTSKTRKFALATAAAALTTVLAIFVVPAVASAATSKRSGLTTVRPVAKPTVVAAKTTIQGGSTGQGPFTEAQCEALGDKAESYNKSGFDKVVSGDVDGGQRDGAAAQALVDYGTDNGCFFTVPW